MAIMRGTPPDDAGHAYRKSRVRWPRTSNECDDIGLTDLSRTSAGVSLLASGPFGGQRARRRPFEFLYGTAANEAPITSIVCRKRAGGLLVSWHLEAA